MEALLDRAFGTDRHGRTAYRLRAGVAAIPELSFAARLDGELAGTIQCWPVMLRANDGSTHPLVLVGPLAVEPVRQRQGIGHLLMEAALTAAKQTGDDARLMLIGDPEYYGRFFGFSAERTAGWRLPGPVERRRLLARGAEVPATDGVLGPRPPA